MAITRARHAVVLVGDARTLKASPHWQALIGNAAQRGLYYYSLSYGHVHVWSVNISADFNNRFVLPDIGTLADRHWKCGNPISFYGICIQM